MNCLVTSRSVMSEPEWRALHLAHGEPSKVYPKNQPPAGTYKIYVLQCPCQAEYVSVE